jgi:hypothetical protein
MPSTESQTHHAPAPAPSFWDRSAAGRLFARALSFELVMISALLIIPILMAMPFTHPRALLQDPDIWWHLANARHLFADGFIHVEPYSYTVAGKPWINPEWGAEIPYWLGYSAWGVHGLLIVAILAAELNLLGIYLLARLRSGHLWSSFVAAFLVTPLLFVNLGTRTILWGYLCLILELAILEGWKRGHRRLLWLLPPLFALWINIHGSWSIGAFLFGVFVANCHLSYSWGDFYSERRSLPELRQLWVVAILSAGALFLNPYGWRLIWNPIDMAFYQKLNIAVAEEWRPLDLGSLVGRFLILIAVLILASNGLRRRRWDLFEGFLIAFGLYAAIDHIRFCFLLGILAAPILAWDLHRTWLGGGNPDKKRPLLNAAFVIAFWAFTLFQVPTATRVQAAYQKKFPTALMAKIQPNWRLLNSMNLGGWLAFHHEPDFIDTRYDTFDHHGVLRSFLEAMGIQNPLEVLNQYRIDHVLFEQDSPLVYLLLHSGGWKQIGEQNGFVLLARTNS